MEHAPTLMPMPRARGQPELIPRHERPSFPLAGMAMIDRRTPSGLIQSVDDLVREHPYAAVLAAVLLTRWMMM